jgi:DNA polymerase III delta subunit
MPRGNELSELFKALAAGQLQSVYAVVGSDPGLREELISRIQRAVLGEKTSETSAVVFGPPDPARPASAPTVAAVMDEVRTPSLFAAKKLILVRAADHLIGGKGSSGAAAVADYLKSPVPGTVLILDLEKLDKRTALAKALVASGGLVECPRLYASGYGETAPSMNSSMGAYLRQLATDRKLKLSNEAGTRLLELADGEAGRLGAELDKLAEFLRKEKRAATAADVDRLASRGAENINALVSATLCGDTSRALLALERVYERGMDMFGRTVWDQAGISIAVVSALTRELRRVERTQLNGGRCPRSKRGKPLPPQVARPIEDAARRLAAGALERAYRLLLEADLALKSSSGRSHSEIVTELLVRLGRSSKKPITTARR